MPSLRFGLTSLMFLTRLHRPVPPLGAGLGALAGNRDSGPLRVELFTDQRYRRQLPRRAERCSLSDCPAGWIFTTSIIPGTCHRWLTGTISESPILRLSA